MRQLMSETDIEVPGLNVGLTGEPVLDYDEMEQSKHDAILATIVSLVVSSLDFHLRLPGDRPAAQDGALPGHRAGLQHGVHDPGRRAFEYSDRSLSRRS